MFDLPNSLASIQSDEQRVHAARLLIMILREQMAALRPDAPAWLRFLPWAYAARERDRLARIDILQQSIADVQAAIPAANTDSEYETTAPEYLTSR